MRLNFPETLLLATFKSNFTTKKEFLKKIKIIFKKKKDF